MAKVDPSVFQTINPATSEVIETFMNFSQAQIEEVLNRSVTTFNDFRKLSVYRRAELLQSLASALRRNREVLAATVTREMGKIIAEAEAEVEKCAQQAEWYAEHGPRMLADQPGATGTTEAYVAYRPLGAILAVMPWNFPLWQVTRFCIPTLLAGNTVLLKHAPNTQRCALELERVICEAGFHEGVFQNLILDLADVSGVIRDPRVAGVSVTGSVRAGSAVAAEAGRMIKPSILELGGSDAFIVLTDADLPGAVAAATRGRFANAGQVCLAAKRFLLAREIAPEFEDLFVRATQALRVGNPLDRSNQLGPMARGDLREELLQQVERSVAQGANVLSQGGPEGGRGFYYHPTVLSGVREGMPVFDSETFGPVAALTCFTDVDDAVRLSNGNIYGLSANVWTKDIALARRMAGELDVGGVFINGVASSNPRLPIGGVKQSGYGRELSHFGAHAFVNIQTVCIDNN